MNKYSNFFTTHIPLFLFLVLGFVVAFCNNSKLSFFLIITMMALIPIQGLVIIFRKNVFSKVWLSVKEKILLGSIYIFGSVIAYAIYKDDINFLLLELYRNF